MSLSMKICAQMKVERRTLSLLFSPSHGPLRYDASHSRVTRVSRSPLCEKPSAWLGDSFVSTCRERQKHSWRWVPFTADWLAGCLTSFLTSWILFGCLTDWLTDLPVDLKTDELIDWLSGSDCRTDWLLDRLRLTDWRTDWLLTFLFYFRRGIHHCILQ